MTACTHEYSPSERAGYGFCLNCGTYRSTEALPPSAIYGSGYWSEAWGHSTIEEQAYNVDAHRENGITKNEFLLARIDTPGRGAVLEIGCAPGVLLRRLKEDAGFDCVYGVEADGSYESEIRRIGKHGGPFLIGLFPEATDKLLDGTFDCILASDVFEHSFEPDAFLAEAFRLLRRGGQLLMMCPIIGMSNGPAGNVNEEYEARMFHPVEHVYIHSQQHVSLMMAEAGFGFLRFDRWCPGHETVSGRKP